MDNKNDEGLNKNDFSKNIESEQPETNNAGIINDPTNQEQNISKSKEEIDECRKEIQQEIDDLNNQLKDAKDRLKKCGSNGLLGMGNVFGFLGGKRSSKNKKVIKNKSKSKKSKKCKK